MTDTLLLTAAKALKLDDDIELFKALAKLKIGPWPVEGFSDAEALLDSIAAGLQSDAVDKAVEKLGLEDQQARIVAFVNRVKELGGKVPAKYKALLERLSHFPVGNDSDLSNLDWTISSSGDPVVTTPKYSLSLDGQAGVTLDAGAAWPGSAPLAKRLMLEVSGEAKAGASASFPYSFGAGSGKLAASAHVGLGYYYLPEGDPFYALAVAERLPHLPNPFDLQSIWTEMHDGDRGLDGVIYDFKGDADASFDLTFADAQGLARGVVLDTGFKVGVRVGFKSTYKLTLRKTAKGVQAALSRKRLTEREFHDSLDLTVDIGSLTTPVAAALQRAADDWDDVLKKIQPYLSPGDLLRDKLVGTLDAAVKQLVADATLSKALSADLTALFGPKPLGDLATETWLSQQIAGAVNRGHVLIDGQVNAAVDRVMAALAKVVPQAVAVGPQLRTLVTAQLTKLENDLATAVEAARSQSSSDLKAALKKLDVKLDGWVNQVNGALGPVRDLINRFDTLLHSILATAKIAAEKKVTARLYREELRQSEITIELQGEFLAVTPATSALFRTIVWGRLQALAELFDNTVPIPDFELDRAASRLARTNRFSSTEGFEIAFINVLASAKTVTTGEVKVVVDGQGNIHVAVEGEIRRVMRSWFNDREISFSDGFSLVQARKMADAPDGAPPTMELSIGAIYGEKSLDRKDVTRFVGDLAAAGLVGDDVVAKASAVYDSWSQIAGSGAKIPAEISAVLRLKGHAVQSLLALASYPNRAVLSAGLEALVSSKRIKRAMFESGAHTVSHQWGRKPGPTDSIDIVLGYEQGLAPVLGLREKVPTDPPTYDSGPLRDDAPLFAYFMDTAFRLKSLSKLIAIMAEIYNADPNDADWSRTYAQLEERLLKCCKPWMELFRSVDDWIRDPLPARSMAFLKAMADLAGGQMIVTMTWNKKGDQRVASFGEDAT